MNGIVAAVGHFVCFVKKPINTLFGIRKFFRPFLVGTRRMDCCA